MSELSTSKNKKHYSYQAQLRFRQWKYKRKQILKRDDYKCRCCGSNQKLNVHHKQYHICSNSGIRKAPWQYKNDYLITLCESCHKAGHAQYNIPVFHI